MTVQTRRERREQQRRKKRPQQRGGGRPTDRSGTIITIAFVGIVILGGVFLLRQVGAFEAPPAPLDAGSRQFDPGSETIGTKYPDEGNPHITAGQRASYNTTPPTSGPHYDTPASWGIHAQQVEDEVIVHNLEHGGIVVFYNNLSSDDLSKLTTLVKQLSNGQYRKMILEPYAQLTDAKVALSAWTWQLKLVGYDETQIVKFVRSHYQGKDAPEPNAQ